jgi:hypothetical protein
MFLLGLLFTLPLPMSLSLSLSVAQTGRKGFHFWFIHYLSICNLPGFVKKEEICITWKWVISMPRFSQQVNYGMKITHFQVKHITSVIHQLRQQQQQQHHSSLHFLHSTRASSPEKQVGAFPKSLSKEHPIVSLNVGTLRPNVSSALKAKPTLNDEAGLPEKTAPTVGGGTLGELGKAVGADMVVGASLIEASTVHVKAGAAERAEVANAVVACLRGAARQACKVKRRCQGIFGRYIERVTVGEVSPADRRFLELTSPSIPPMDLTSTDGVNQRQDDDDHKPDQQEAFIGCFMRYLYSGKVLLFIFWLFDGFFWQDF